MGKMSIQTIRDTFARVAELGWAGPKLDVVWHAGEPLVMPCDYYAEASQAIADAIQGASAVRNCFQTNGMLIDDAWCGLFREIRANVGVSIDGPAAIHDASRRTRGGRGTFAETLAGIRLLRKHDLPFYVLTVLSDASLDHPRELFEFYRSENIRRIGFNIEEIEGPHTHSSLSRPDRRARFDRFMREFWTLVQQSSETYFVREFSEMLQRITSPTEIDLANDLTEPFAILNVDWQGNFTTFSPELLGQENAAYGDFILGNVARTSLEASRQTETFQRLSRDIAEGVAECRASCEYFPVCGGGAPSNKLYENGSFASTATLYCELRTKVVADLALEVVEASAAADACGQPAPVDTADLYLLGAGVSFPDHLTSETLSVLDRCVRICSNMPDTVLDALPEGLRAKCISLRPLYRDKRRRLENYRDVIAAVLDTVARERPVAWITPGHPNVFDSVTSGLLRAAEAQGLRIRTLPGISSFDTIFAELGFDPAEGLFVHEATSVIARNIALQPAVATLLLQPGVFGSQIAHTETPYAELNLARLRDYLLRFFAPEHRCAFVRSAEARGLRSQEAWVHLANLASVPYDTVVGSTLFIPAVPTNARTN